MLRVDFKSKSETPVALALGFFDCIHRGHERLVHFACEYAKFHSIQSALLTFDNDPSELLGGERQIYSFEERAEALKNLGLDILFYTTFDRAFSSLSPNEFLNALLKNLNIKAIIVGSDYTFGQYAKGNIDNLRKFGEENGIEVVVLPFVMSDGSKISTSNLKKYIKCGDLSAMNEHLSEPYFMLGEIVHARHVGTQLGFPTANIKIADGKLPLASGIYATKLYVDNRCLNSMTNVGAKPTFSIDTPSIETYIFDFDGDIYGKQVKLAYYKRTRDVTKFASAEKLRKQLALDELQIRELLETDIQNDKFIGLDA